MKKNVLMLLMVMVAVLATIFPSPVAAAGETPKCNTGKITCDGNVSEGYVGSYSGRFSNFGQEWSESEKYTAWAASFSPGNSAFKLSCERCYLALHAAPGWEWKWYEAGLFSMAGFYLVRK